MRFSAGLEEVFGSEMFRGRTDSFFYLSAMERRGKRAGRGTGADKGTGRWVVLVGKSI